MSSTRMPRLVFRAGIIVLGAMMLGTAGWWWYWGRPAKRSTDALLRTAIRAADNGDTQASGLLDQVLAVDPGNPKALLYRGQLARDAGDSAAAARYWSQVGNAPAREGGTARFLEGTLLLEANRARDAEVAFRKAIELNPTYLQPRERLLKLHVMQLRVPDIRKELEAIRRVRPWNLDELYQLVNLTGRVTNAVQGLPRVEAFLKVDPADRHSLIAQGRFYLWDDRFREAADVFRKVLKLQADDIPTAALLAEALVGQLDTTGAKEVLQKLPADVNSHQYVWKSHGLYWVALQDWPKAVACLQRAVILDRNDLAAVYKLSQALERVDDKVAAGKQLDRVHLLEKLQAEMWIVAQWDRKNAGPPLKSVVEAGTLLLQLERQAEAVPFLELAAEWDPSSVAVRDLLVKAIEQSLTESNPAQALAALPKIDVQQWVGASSGGASTSSGGVEKSVVIPPKIQFVDRHVEAGLQFQFFNGDSGQKYLLETTGGGVSALDYDGDDWPDLYFPQGCRLPFAANDLTHVDRLSRNLHNGTFADVTANAGLGDNQHSQGCSVADFDNDGFPDLAVANYGTNVLYKNNGDGTFTDVTLASGMEGSHWSTSLGWGDLDRDGNLDLYVVNYVLDGLKVCRKPSGAPATCHPQVFAAEDDIFYRSRGDGTFENLTHDAGLTASNGKGLGVVVADLDGDGWCDIYVANDGTPNFLFQNLGKQADKPLAFAEVGLASGTALSGEGLAQAGMGIGLGDFDGNGLFDLFVTNFYRETNALYLNRGRLQFDDATAQAELAEPSKLMLGFGTQALDVDLDGHLDLMVLNGHVDDHRDEGIPWKMPPQLFYNQGRARFREISSSSGKFFSENTLGRGLARLDWNRDGRPDLVAVHQDCPAALLLNQTETSNHSLTLKLQGTESNRDAIGASIRVQTAGVTQVFAVSGGDGYSVSNERRQTIGLGAATSVEVVEVHWPNGQREQWTDLPADEQIILIEGRAPLYTSLQDHLP